MSNFEARELMRGKREAAGCGLAESSVVDALVKKWEPLLEGIGEDLGSYAPRGQADYVKQITAFLLENEAGHLRRLSEETRAFSVGPFLKFVFPVIRRTAIRLVATSIASVTTNDRSYRWYRILSSTIW